MTNEKAEALQAVLDRVTSYQDGAPEGTVGNELRNALSETDLELDDDVVDRIVTAIEAGDGPVAATDYIGD